MERVSIRDFVIKCVDKMRSCQFGRWKQVLIDCVTPVPLISIEDWIELLMSKNEANGGHIGETTLAGHAL